MAWVSPQVKPDAVLSLHVSVIRKAYAEKMAYLGHVHDGSAGEIVTGYWILSVEAYRADGPRQGSIFRRGAHSGKSSSRRSARCCAWWRWSSASRRGRCRSPTRRVTARGYTAPSSSYVCATSCASSVSG